VVYRAIPRRVLGQAGLKSGEADSGAVTLIQRFSSLPMAGNVNIEPHALPAFNGLAKWLISNGESA
jgi:hypothetical protein